MISEGRFLLGHDDRAADGAVAALGLARRRAGGGDGRVGHGGMISEGRFLLGHDDRAADGTMAALGFARCRAGGGDGGVGHSVVIRFVHFVTPLLRPGGGGGIADGVEGGSFRNVPERPIRDAGGIAENRDVRQAIALIKGVIFDEPNFIRDDNARQVIALGKHAL